MRRRKRQPCLICGVPVNPEDKDVEIMGSHNPKYLCKKCKRKPLIVYQPLTQGRGHTY